MNDNFSNRIFFSGISTFLSGSNTGATKEPGEPNHVGVPGWTSVWWAWTAPKSGPVTITTFGSDFDTLLAVYTGSSVSALTPVASNDDSGGSSASSVTFGATAGLTYQIAVDGYQGASGRITLNLFQP